MIDFWNKLDRELQIIYSNFLMIQKEGRDSASWIHPVLQDERTSLHVILDYSGDLSAIEALGFETSQDKGDGNANGFVNLNQLATIADSTDVIGLRYGSEPKHELDDSVIEILARKDVSGTKPFAWEVDRSTGVFSGNMGENVIVGIIDTGIDFKHKVFFKNDVPETRILRIWDMGLVKTGTEKSPDVNLLDGNKTYGVEYTDEMINKVIQNKSGAPKIRHKDCAGHGTHVAAIAAGDGRQASFIGTQGFDFVGVAPKASIIVVKLLRLTNDPPEASNEQRFKDAVSYILKFAKAQTPPLPVVINCSFGTILGPHDGLEKEIQFLKNFFDSATGAACVFSAGNSAGKRHHAIITIPAGGSIDVPFELTDKRTVKTDKESCVERSNTFPLLIEVWYKDISPNKIKLSLKDPTASAFTAGPDVNQSPVTGTFDGAKTFTISHTKVESEPHPATATKVTRNLISVVVTQEGDNHKTGTYTLKIEGPAATVLHAWTDINRGHRFAVKDPLTGPDATNINVTDDNTIADTRTLPYVLTVASYDHAAGTISKDSSRGPVVDYSGSGLVSKKPDIAAPGQSITSAQSGSGEFPPDLIKLMLGKFYITFGGTSMAAPHIAGVVALMLGKNKSLTRVEIFSKLKARTATPDTDFGKGKVDVKQTIDAV